MKLENDTIINHSDAIYEGQCSKCGESLEFEASFDADGTSYSAECCELYYQLYPSTVKVTVEKSE